MDKPGAVVLMMLVAFGSFLLPMGCATRSSTSGADDQAGKSLPEERIAAAPLKEILPEAPPTNTRSQAPAIGAELSGTRPSKAPFEDVLFDFDQYQLRRDALSTLEANAKRLKNDGVKKVLLEGRTDEIGTVAYNLVLGERRAVSVKRYLENLGIAASILTIVSYGKDRPLCVQHHPECWQKNRSVRFNVRE